MLSKAVALLAAANLIKESVALNAHRHAHYQQKKDLEKKGVVTDVVTDVVVVTDWVTVTADSSESSTSTPIFVENTHVTTSTTSSSTSTTSTTSTSSTPTSTSTSSTSTSSTSVAVPSTTSTTSAPTTLSTQVTSSSSSSALINVQAVVATTSSSSSASSAAAASTASSSSSSSIGRGLAYNDGSLLSGFLGSGTLCTWKYNWGQTDDSTSADVEFVPMLWGTASEHTSTWNSNAEAAISAGSTHLLSFNEPDYASQADLTPAEAATAHIEWMNPFSGKAKIGGPAITNSPSSSDPPAGIEWLSEFITACDGNCDLDFQPIHWYNSANATEFIEHIKDVYAVAKVPIWVTEFEPLDVSDDEKSTFLTEVFSQLESLDYVERVAYFMVATGNLVSSGTTLSSYGEVYAYN